MKRKTRLRGLPPDERFWHFVDKTDSCWIWQGALRSRDVPYGKFEVEGRAVGAHRYSYFIAHGHWPKGLCLHSCDNPRCVNPSHLRDGTSKDNLDDARSRGRAAIGEAHPSVKLDEEKVRQIRRRRADGESIPSLAKIYGVSTAAIGQIVQRMIWKHVK